MISYTVWTLFSYYPLDSMKRAASLNYLNKTSDDQFQVRKRLHKVLYIIFNVCFIMRNVIFYRSYLSPRQYLCSVFLCFFVRLREAVISGRAGAWAPALWISTLETEPQVADHAHRPKHAPYFGSFLWATTITNNTTRRRHAHPPPHTHTLSLTHFPPGFRPKDIFSHQNILDVCVCFLLLWFWIQVVFFLVFQAQIAVRFPNTGVASVPPKCGQQSIPHFSLLNNHCDSVHFDFICCHNVTCSGHFLLMLFWFEICVSSCAIHCFLPKNRHVLNRSVGYEMT